MSRRVILASIVLAASTAACINPISYYHGYTADEIQPEEVKPGEDTRASVLAQLGSPSTESLMDDNTWYYISTQRDQVAFMIPETAQRNVTAIQFNEDGVVEELMTYNETDGKIVNYASRETPTRGRELGFWEQVFGTVGAVRLPETDERTPGNQRRN